MSDTHFNHSWINQAGEKRGVIYFERTQFKTIQEHDDFIYKKLIDWAKTHNTSPQTLWLLGDFGDISYLPLIADIKTYGHTVNFIKGNHDFAKDMPIFEKFFDNVYTHPFFLTDRVILSHHPLYPLPFGTINIAGHLHGATLDSKVHCIVSANNINYQPISDKKISKMLMSTPKPDYHFLKEPYADKYVFLKEKDDVVYDPMTKKIDLPASIKKFYKVL